ncbi:trypsin-like serine peptidase, partial [Burkholderia gladioli]|uniref:trypsin-like serine peptidase n=4 Tax=Burkholderiaceae TaxID=119060 RepID=UPI003F7A436F
TMQLESRYAGTTSSTYAMSITDSPIFSDGQAPMPSRQDRNPISASVVTGLILGAANVFYGWYQTSTIQQRLDAARAKAALFYQSTVAKYISGSRPSGFTEYAPIGGLAALTMDQSTGKFLQQTCSATVVPSRGRNLIMTAAHCLFNPAANAWASVGAFCLGGNEVTNDGMLYCPVERRFTIQNLQNGSIVAHLNKIWDRYPSGVAAADDARFAEYDLAFVELKPNAVTQKNVEDVVGSYGIVFNSNPNDVKSATLAGYPGSNNLKFLMCQKNISPTHVSNTVSSKDGNLLGIMTGNVYEIQDECSKMTQGSSGGPWLLRSKQKNMEQLIFGVNAKLVKTKADKWFLWGGDDAQNTGVFSPPLVGWTQTLYEGASGMTTIAY